jgi:Tol biopolymer transport system component
VKLLRAGTVTVRASDGRNEGSREVTVAAPPSIVFDRVVGSNRDLWRVDLDGANLVRLTDDAADDSDPTVAAGRIVFVSLRAGLNSDLYSMPLAGGAATRITVTGANEGMPALSPDGQRLAYTFEGTGIAKLWLSAANGAGAARASSLGGDFAIDASPTWAANSSRVVFSSSAEGTPDLFSLTPPAAPVLLAGGSGNDVDPAFSPDGQFVAFASTRGGGSGTSLYIVAVSSGLVTRLTTATLPQGQPAWTSDGRLVFTEFGANGGQLRWIDPAAPAIVHTIDTGAGSARNPAGVP